VAPDPEPQTEGRQPVSAVSPEEAVKLSAEQRERMERETARLREQDEDNARRVEHVRARVHAYLGDGRAH
jgi:hypothetical protein